MMTPDKNLVAESCRRQDSWNKKRKRNLSTARFGGGFCAYPRESLATS
jgi:hypothetical protein